MALLGAATLGAFAVAFSSTKMGNQLLNRFITLAARVNPKAGRSDPLDDERIQAMFI
jgi:hypothetical protein